MYVHHWTFRFYSANFKQGWRSFGACRVSLRQDPCGGKSLRLRLRCWRAQRRTSASLSILCTSSPVTRMSCPWKFQVSSETFMCKVIRATYSIWPRPEQEEGSHTTTTDLEEVLSWNCNTWLAYYGAQNDHTHYFIIWELIFQLHRTSVTQGFLAGII